MKTIEQPVIFFPGMLCDERIWLPVWQRMSFQQRSYVPLQWADSLAQMLALSQDRIDSFEQEVHLVGFSMGGFIASVCASQAPGRIASLTLIGYNPKGLTNEEIRAREQLLKTLHQNTKLTMNKARLKQFVTSDELNNENITGPVLEMEKDLGNTVLRGHIQSTTPREDMSKQLQNAPFQINFITAQHDKIADCDSIAQLSQRCLKSTHLNLQDTAHMMLLSQPDVIADQLYKLLN
ncbi:alpha/beta fold hydrolase [Aliiglaciecola sp. M165]|uniref:alpha/beta fold hydrolase n=1 Tax=Aliiglaciecola sp. M165 TaxID=2593649 RepID=UPI00117F4612|nr:alpha/beta hydrolase [Aliiglaciecola sp. M165]TRY33879.1 alpha/beta hydrolase [Aliiglaciecola sp. M165]